MNKIQDRLKRGISVKRLLLGKEKQLNQKPSYQVCLMQRQLNTKQKPFVELIVLNIYFVDCYEESREEIHI